MTLSIPVWVTHWVDLSVLHQALDAVASMLEALQRALPGIGSMLQWLVPVTWVLWGLGVSVLFLLSAAAHLLMRRFKRAAAPTRNPPAASSGLVAVAVASTALLLASGVHTHGTTL